MKYAVVIERADSNYSAYVPDLPGCIAAGATMKETENSIWGAIEFHIQSMKKDGLSVPLPSSSVKYIEVTA